VMMRNPMLMHDHPLMMAMGMHMDPGLALKD